MSIFAGSFVPMIVVAAASAAPTAFLESAAIRLEWDAGGGALVSLKDKATGREWLDPAARTPIYVIQFADGSPPLASTNAASVDIRSDGDSVTIEAAHEGREGASVTCRFRAVKGSPHILGRLAVHSKVPRAIADVRFPMVRLRLPFSGNGEDDCILRPECDGVVLRQPGTNMGERALPYPGSASLQMVAAFDPAAGVYMAARDAGGHSKSFVTRSNGKTADLSISHLLPQVPITRWELGYDVDLAGLRPSGGLDKITWEAAADLYRTWAVAQPWCRQTAAQRVAAGDIPAWLAEPRMILCFSLRGLMPDGRVGNRLPLVVEQADRWGKIVGAPITCLIMSWEKLDTWVTPDYFPPFGGEDAFAAMTRALHARGHRTMVFLSGLHWTLRKDLAGPDRPHVLVDQREDFERRGRQSAISDAKGVAEIIGKPTEGVGEHATICASTPLAREILLGASMGCQARGIDCVQVDQIVGGGMRPCYHPGHGHPPGGGAWCSEALYRVFGDIRKEGRSRDSQFAFAIEEPNEFYLPLLDTYHARDLHQGRWPRSGAGVLGVPLFTHVYHDYSAGYGSEGCYVSDKPSQLALYQIGMNLVCGKIPAVALWGRWLDPEKMDPVQRRLLRAHIELWRGPAGEFLTFGQRVASPELDVPRLDMAFTEKDGKTRRPLSFPSVLHGAWRLADGRRANLFACIGEGPVAFEFRGERMRLEPGEAVVRAAR